MKNIHLNDLDNYYKKKQVEEMQKNQDSQKNMQNMEYNINSQNERDNQYKRKLETLNGKIYDNVKKHSEYLSKSQNNVVDPHIFDPKRDYEVNRSLAELKDRERQLKNNPGLIEQRLIESEKQREFESKLKSDRLENQKIYKNLLDNQRQQSNNKNQDNNIPPEQNSILPSYNYLSRPYPSNKKAMDSIHLVKNNMLIDNNEEFFAKKGHLHTLMDHNKDFYLGGTKLNHNPITNPVSDLNYNRYLYKNVQGNSTPKNEGNKNSAFQKAGERIIN